MNISVVIPVYGCKTCLMELCSRLESTLSRIVAEYEIILVNDASPDNAWEIISCLVVKDQRIKGINLSKNFGQHHAITAGLDYTCGEWVVVMDCDLQDQPEEIYKLYNEAIRGYDVVLGRRVERKDSVLKKTGSKLFYSVYDYLTDQQSDATIANFGIYNQKVIDNIKKMREQNRNFPLFVRWLGFKVSEIDIEHAVRAEGISSYNLKKLLNLAIDSIVSQSNKPLRLSIKAGFFLSFVSFVYAIYLISRHFFLGVSVPGWTSVMVSLYFIAGLVLANMGVLGLYLGKIFDETKGRPLYVVKDEVGFREGPMTKVDK